MRNSYSIKIDESNMYIIQKFIYYLHINNKLKDIYDYHLNGIIDVRSVKTIFAIPLNEFYFDYCGESIEVCYQREPNLMVDRGNVVKMSAIILRSTTLNTLHTFLYEIEKLEFNIPDNKLIKYIWKDSYWKYCNSFKTRSINTIYLPNEHMSNTINEITTFLSNNHELYQTLGLQKKKIILFWGLPGCGKTTFVKAIASEFKKNIAVIKNTNDINDNSFESMIDELPKNCIVLFEDIDSLFNGRSNVAGTSITFSGLLNFLDGIMEYENLLVFITTNNLGCIDDALKRRIDISLEFSYIRKPEVLRMFTNFFEDKYSFEDFMKKLKSPVTPSMLEKYFTKCITEQLSPITNIAILDTFIKLSQNNMNQMYR